MNLLVKKLSTTAKLPTKAYPSDAGFDLYIDLGDDKSQIELQPQQRITLKTGISIKLPEGYCGIFKDRSGLAVKNGLHILAGVIDCNFLGELAICVLNTDKQKSHILYHGDKLTQMLIVPVPFIQIKEVNELPITDRGDKGFGSSGNN